MTIHANRAAIRHFARSVQQQSDEAHQCMNSALSGLKTLIHNHWSDERGKNFGANLEPHLQSIMASLAQCQEVCREANRNADLLDNYHQSNP